MNAWDPGYLLFGLFFLLWGWAGVWMARRVGRYWRTLRHGRYIDLTVVGATVGGRGPGGTVWIKTILEAALPNGRSHRVITRIEALAINNSSIILEA